VSHNNNKHTNSARKFPGEFANIHIQEQSTCTARLWLLCRGFMLIKVTCQL